MIAVLPWTLVAAAGVVLASSPHLLQQGQSTSGSSTDPWTAADPGGGFAEVGWFGLPWVPSLIILAILRVASIAWRELRNETVMPLRDQSPLWLTMRGQVAVLLPLILAMNLVSGSDPIVYGSVNSPGPEVSEIRTGATWFDEKDPSGWGMTLDATHYVYRADPGDAFSYIFSVRNDWPLPITLLGVTPPRVKDDAQIPEGMDFVISGLGLLRDPAVASAEVGRVVPFHPIVLASGQEVALVVASIAGTCADATGEVDPPDPPNVTSSDNRSVEIVYEIAGWRRVGRTYPPFGLSVPTIEGCMPIV